MGLKFSGTLKGIPCDTLYLKISRVQGYDPKSGRIEIIVSIWGSYEYRLENPSDCEVKCINLTLSDEQLISFDNKGHKTALNKGVYIGLKMLPEYKDAVDILEIEA